MCVTQHLREDRVAGMNSLIARICIIAGGVRNPAIVTIPNFCMTVMDAPVVLCPRILETKAIVSGMNSFRRMNMKKGCAGFSAAYFLRLKE